MHNVRIHSQTGEAHIAKVDLVMSHLSFNSTKYNLLIGNCNVIQWDSMIESNGFWLLCTEASLLVHPVSYKTCTAMRTSSLLRPSWLGLN